MMAGKSWLKKQLPLDTELSDLRPSQARASLDVRAV